MAKTPKDRAKPRQSDDRQESPLEASFHLGGFLGKLGTVVEKLVDLAESGQDAVHTGEIKGLDPQGKVRGVYGFSVKTALGQQGQPELKIEPFGNISRKPSGETVVEDVREPLADVYEEEDHTLVLAEIPGVSKKDVELELSGNRLTIRAVRGEKRYHKEVELPEAFTAEKMHWECTNGILKIRLER
jgi:HSP20 family protein